MQNVFINLDGGDLPMRILKPGEGPGAIVRCEDDPIEFAMLKGGMQSGGASVAFSARMPDGGKVAMIELSAAMLMHIAAAVRGRLQDDGTIPTALNPGIAISSSVSKRRVHFCMEAAIVSWDYDADEAMKFARVLKGCAEHAGGK